MADTAVASIAAAIMVILCALDGLAAGHNGESPGLSACYGGIALVQRPLPGSIPPAGRLSTSGIRCRTRSDDRLFGRDITARRAIAAHEVNWLACQANRRPCIDRDTGLHRQRTPSSGKVAG